jgi:CRP-like cAMP-binding protein
MNCLKVLKFSKGDKLYIKNETIHKRSFLLLKGKIGLFKGFSDNKIINNDPIFFGGKTEGKADKENWLWDFEQLYGSLKRILREGEFFGHRLVDGLEAKRMLSAVAVAESEVLVLEEKDHDDIFYEVNKQKDDTRLEILKNVFPYIFLGSKNSLVPFMDSMIKLKVRRGRTVIIEDKETKYFYLLLEGRVKLYKYLDTRKLITILQGEKSRFSKIEKLGELEDPSQKRSLERCIDNIILKLKQMETKRKLMIGTLEKHDVFGEEALFQGEEKTALFSAECETDCKFMMIKDRDLKTMPENLRMSLTRGLRSKVKLRMKRYNQQCPKLLRNFEEKVKKMDYLNLANLFEFVNEDQKAQLLSKMLSERKIKVKGQNKMLRQKPKMSKQILKQIQSKILKKGRLRNIFRQKQEEEYQRSPLMAQRIADLRANDPVAPKTMKVYLKRRKINSSKFSKNLNNF